ncbi:unnamed protein product [Brassicogethes aeneus]|uniref:Glucose-methanol-choline oxidoreductase N-terminal domain-containing protein n=1 Tax=Brassicogethes aeneus TaxID=1431903 RepID=A0A9P0BJQ3_BRAAE|nr:unnamed protein product [Brassicogethes aeneus]
MTMLIFFIILNAIYFIHCVSDEEVAQFTMYLEDEMEKAQNGELRNDSSQFKPLKDEPPIDFGCYDFIIIGAGSTGTILANRLSEEEDFKVLLIEAGGYPNNYTDVPFVIGLSRFTKFNWGYKTVPQKHSCLGMINQQCIVPRGQGVGGTTLINDQIYVRGHPHDFDRWESLGNPGWSYEDVLPIFKKTEAMHQNNPQAVVDWPYHNTSGLLYVEYYPTTDPQLNAWYEAQASMGYNFADSNSPEQIGFGPLPACIRNGKKVDDGTAFILPILSRGNLKVQNNSLVTKILIEKDMKGQLIATGVNFSYNRTTYVARANKEVIVSGGSINTPQILMLSGVGPKKHLREKTIQVLKDLPVGKTLRDHPAFYGLLISSNYTEPIQPFEEYVREYLNGYGPLTVPGGLKGLSFYKTKFESVENYPDLEILYGSGNCTSAFIKKEYNLKDETYEAIYAPLDPPRCFFMVPTVLHTKSVGSVKLKTNDPYDFPLIDFNNLSDKDNIDAKTIYEGIKMGLSWVQHMQAVNATLGVKKLPACEQYEFLSEQYWYCAIGQVTSNLYHPVGTCPMGPDPKKYVVNHEFKVHGVHRLRVADASVFPHTLSGHPNAPCVMLGEKLAIILKKQYL